MGAEQFRYLVGGVLCALVNNVILIVGDLFGAGYLELTFLTFGITGTVGYVFHSRVTFRQVVGWASYGAFMAGIAFGIPVALVILTVLHSLLGLPMWIAAPALTGLMLVYNYVNARLAITEWMFGAFRNA